ncbi:MAG TPA: hypothetical protein DFR83_03935, partial [Deltaproteobacteria bacterium]|nr:hypothetical protein [Deltaproteobacteria bacterium]
LDGSGSSDPDGTSLAYTWQLTSAPTASLLTSGDIEYYTDEAPSFWPDEPGDYQFALSVTDEGDEVSFPDTVTATVVAHTSSSTAPVADAGADETTNATIDCYPLSYGEVFECTTCQPINLSVDATASSDADGEQLTYEWAVLSGDVVILSQSDGAASIVIDSTTQAEYGATVTDTYELEVTVTDCTGDTDTDTVVISYECTGA